MLCSNQPALIYVAHVAGWEPHSLHDLGHVFLGWICTTQILHNLSQSAGEELDDLDQDHDLCVQGVKRLLL